MRSVNETEAKKNATDKLISLGIVAAISLAIGCIDPWAQGFLPHTLRSLANSSSGWTLVTAVLVFWSRLNTPLATLAGATSFVLLVTGYAIASDWRGYYFNPTTWIVIGVAAGPFVGAASAWLRRPGIRSALGAGLLSGIAIGEAIYGLTAIVETTSATYWVATGLVGLALLALIFTRQIREIVPTLALFGMSAVVAFAFNLAYRGLG